MDILLLRTATPLQPTQINSAFEEAIVGYCLRLIEQVIIYSQLSK